VLESLKRKRELGALCVRRAKKVSGKLWELVSHEAVETREAVRKSV